MAGVLRHRKVSTKADGTDPAKVLASEWGSTATDYATAPTHVLSGGAHGALLWYDTTAIDNGNWLADVAVGSILASGGVGAPPAWTATPTLTGLGLGDSPFSSAGLRIHNANGPGAIIQRGTASNTRAPLVFLETDGSTVLTYFNSSSSLITCSNITMAGNLSGPGGVGTVDANGNFTVSVLAAPGNNITSMIDIYADVDIGIVARAHAGGAGKTYVGLDSSGNYTHGFTEFGQLQFGAGASWASMDTALARASAGVLEVNSTVLGTYRDLNLRTLGVSGNIEIANSGALRFKDSGGTARNILQVDNGNALILANLAGGNTVIAPASGGTLRIMPAAQNANALTFYDSTQNFTIGTNTDVNYRFAVNRSGSSGTFQAYDSTASTGVTQAHIREGAGQSSTLVFGVYANDGTTLRFGIVNGDVKWGKALVSLGGGASATMGTIGGSGPTTAGQNSWMRVLDSTGAPFWVPAWK